MSYNSFDILEQNVFSITNHIFEPTVNIFQNGIVINHQKVGTRFLQEIASGNSTLASEDNKQIQFQIFNTPHYSDINLKPIKYHFKTRYVCAPWNNNGKKFLTDTYTQWKSDEDFLNSQGLDNYTDFFFNNPNDVIFIIRNPIHRFFSGIIQILAVDIKNITISEFGKILKENWKDILSDIHTVNYLENYKEFIYNIKDKSKVKIIDLSHLKSKKSCDFFCKLRGDDDILPIYENINNHVDSNKKLYSSLYSLYEDIEPNDSTVIQYLKTEYIHYLDLKSSKYFVPLV